MRLTLACILSTCLALPCVAQVPAGRGVSFKLVAPGHGPQDSVTLDAAGATDGSDLRFTCAGGALSMTYVPTAAVERLAVNLLNGSKVTHYRAKVDAYAVMAGTLVADDLESLIYTGVDTAAVTDVQQLLILASSGSSLLVAFGNSPVIRYDLSNHDDFKTLLAKCGK